MKINISDMLDHWQGEVPVPEEPGNLEFLRERTMHRIRSAEGRRPRRRASKALVAAAVIAACVVGVSAATGQIQVLLSKTWQNDVLVSSQEEAQADAAQRGEEYSAWSWSSPNGTPPSPLREMLDSARAKSSSWETDQWIGGAVGPVITQWTGMEVTGNTGPVKSRTVYGLDPNHGFLAEFFPRKYVKYEYTAETPADLATVLSGLVRLDTGWMEESYAAPDWANIYYQIYDSGNTLRGEYCDVFYVTPDNRYVRISYSYAPGASFSPAYRLKNVYDQAESYTSATGLEGLILTKNGLLWADVNTPELNLSLLGGYLTVEEAEAILDHVSLAETP